MNPWILESQIHDSQKVGESSLFIGLMTPDEPDFDHFQPKTACFQRSCQQPIMYRQYFLALDYLNFVRI